MLQIAGEALVQLVFDVFDNCTGEIRDRVHCIIHRLKNSP